MADEYDDDDEQGARLTIEDLRALRKAAKERDQLAAQLAAHERDLAFARAKLDMDDPKVKYFVKGYEGEMTPEAIRAQAEADGFFRDVQVTNGEQQSQQRIVNASSGAGETPPTDLQDLIRNAESADEVMKIMTQAGYPTTWSRD